MNKKLTIILLSLLSIISWSWAGYWGWMYKSSEKSPEISSQFILNSKYKLVFSLTGYTYSFMNGVSGEDKIQENTITFGDLDGNRSLDTVFVVERRWGNKLLWAVLLGEEPPFLIQATLTLPKDAEIVSISIKKNIITLDYILDSGDGRGWQEFVAKYRLNSGEGILIKESVISKSNTLSEHLLMNSDYWGYSDQIKVLKFQGGVYFTGSSSFSIYRTHIANLYNDGAEEVILITRNYEKNQYYLHVVEKMHNRFRILSSALLDLGNKSGEYLLGINVNNGIIELEFVRESECYDGYSETQAYTVERYYLKYGKLVRQPQKRVNNIEILSPAKGEVWRIGEPHKIILSQPWPFEEICFNYIKITLEGLNEEVNFVKGVLINENEWREYVSLEKGVSEYTWDTEHILRARNYYEQDLPILTPGAYTITISSTVTAYPEYVYETSGVFQITK